MNNYSNYKKLDDIAKICLGLTYTPKYMEQGVPFLSVKDITKGKISYENTKFISVEEFMTAPSGAKPQKGDILFGRVGTIGQPQIVTSEVEFCIFVSLGFLKITDENVINTYVRYWMLSHSFDRQVNENIQGIGVKNLNTGTLKNFILPFPSLPIQHQIVSELDTLSEIITKKKQQLADLDKLAQATFYDMFGDPVKNEKGWDVGCLKNYTTKIGSGSTPSGGNQSYKSEGISLIRSMNVLNGSFKYKDLAYIDDIQAKQLDNVAIQEHDVLINITGASVARSCIVPQNILPARVNQHVSIIRLKADLNSVFVNSLFISPYFQVKLIELGKSNGATREAITKSQLEQLKIPLPPITIQLKFANKIEIIKKQKELIKKSIEDVQQLFDFTMIKYFN